MNFSEEELQALRNILRVNLGVKNGERLFILAIDPLTLTPSVEEKGVELLAMAEKVAEMGEEITHTELVVFPSPGMHGVEPPVKVWKNVLPDAFDRLEERGIVERILTKNLSVEEEEFIKEVINSSKDRVDVVVSMTYYSTSHTIFRRMLNLEKKTRYASMPLFERYMLTGAMNVDYNKVEALSLSVKEKLDGAEAVYITSPNGTNLKLVVKEREFIADTGILTSPGAFGNLPAGEVFVAPQEGLTEGKLVIEYGPDEGKLPAPLEVFIEGGMAREIVGEGELKNMLESKFEEDERCRNIAELGIGTNAGATHVENILEAEKILGTIHIAFGDNSSFGGKVKAPFHEDFVVFSPTVKVEKEGEVFYLHQSGKLLV